MARVIVLSIKFSFHSISGLWLRMMKPPISDTQFVYDVKKNACPDLGDHAFIHKWIELRLEFVMPFLTSPEIIPKLKNKM